jgi:hypothetical protein
MAFWIMLIGAVVYIVCNQVTGKNPGVQSFLACAAELGRLAFLAGILGWMLRPLIN